MAGSVEFSYGVDVEVTSERAGAATFRAIAPFPWTESDEERLWKGEFRNLESMREGWAPLMRKYNGVVAVGGGSLIRLILTRPKQTYLQLHTTRIPKETGEVSATAWSVLIKSEEIALLLAFAAGGVIYVLNVETGEYHGILLGHGGRINALAVHPVNPNILASASHDHSVRIYDLTEEIATKLVDNPKWPGLKFFTQPGPAFGQRASEREGDGLGNCFAILSGGPSGGHQAAVLDVAFHPTLPMIATCGLDHAVKIWRLPPAQGTRIARADKPLFSSSQIHRSRVTSITWMSEDVLLTHSGPVSMRPSASLGNDGGHLVFGPGTLVLWRWLGLRRFFPANREDFPALLRGCNQDYLDSSSYKTISEYLTNPNVGKHESIPAAVFQSPGCTPIVALPWGTHVNLTSLKQFSPRERPSFPPARVKTAPDEERPAYMDFLPMLPGVPAEKNGTAEVKACAFVDNGRVLVAIGEGEGIWIWREGSGTANQPLRID